MENISKIPIFRGIKEQVDEAIDSQVLIENLIKQSEPSPHHSKVPLPSNGVFYPKEVTAIYARRFDIADINALATGKARNDMAEMIRAIGETITVPVSMLTQDDFQALCYWHRVNSYPSKPMELTWECTNPSHVALAKKDLTDDLSEDEHDAISDAKRYLKNKTRLTNSNQVSVNTFTKERYTALKAFLQDESRHTKGFVFIPPTVGDLIEFAELSQVAVRQKKISELETTPENLELILDEIVDATADGIIMRVATNLSAQHGYTLQERIQYVLENTKMNPGLFDTRFLSDIETFEELSAHETRGTFVGTCKYGGCRQRTQLHTEFDLFNFFPFV